MEKNTVTTVTTVTTAATRGGTQDLWRWERGARWYRGLNNKTIYTNKQNNIHNINKKSMTINNQFIEENAYIVRTIVKQYHYLNIEEDLMQEGYIGLVEAGRKYNPECGVLFESYAAWWVRKYVKKGIQQYAYMMRMPTHPKKDYLQKQSVSYDQALYEEDGDVITLSDILADDTDLEERLDKKLLREELLRGLSEREQIIVRYFYGLDGQYRCTEEIAEEMKIKTKYIYDIFERAVKKMQKKLQSLQNFS